MTHICPPLFHNKPYIQYHVTDLSPLLFDNKHYVQKIEVVELQINKVAPPLKKSVWLYRKNVKFFMITKLLKKQKNM